MAYPHRSATRTVFFVFAFFVIAWGFSTSWALPTVGAASPPEKPTAEHGKGKRYDFDGLTVMVLEGSWHDMGVQYGKLMKKEMRYVRTLMEVGFRSILGAERFDDLTDLAESQLDLYPKRFRDIHAGLREGSGMSTRDVALLEHLIAGQIAVMEGLFCSSITAWGEYADDGNLIMGRNFDYPDVYSQVSPFFCLTVYRPDDGAVPTATLGYVGHIGAVNVFNAEGLVAEVNVAIGMPEDNRKVRLDRVTAPITLLTLGFDCSGMNQLDAAMNTYRFNFPLLCTVADTIEARTYEVGTRDVRRRDRDAEGLNTVTNWVAHPDWGPVERFFDDPRHDRLRELARRNKGRFNIAVMKELLERTIDEGGVTIPQKARFAISTLHQFVYVPATGRLSVRQPGYMPKPVENSRTKRSEALNPEGLKGEGSGKLKWDRQESKGWIDLELKPLFGDPVPTMLP